MEYKITDNLAVYDDRKKRVKMMSYGLFMSLKQKPRGSFYKILGSWDEYEAAQEEEKETAPELEITTASTNDEPIYIDPETFVEKIILDELTTPELRKHAEKMGIDSGKIKAIKGRGSKEKLIKLINEE